jgi:hypothetical protein
LKILVITLAICFLTGCSPIERTAYNTVIAAKAFLNSEKAAHPECQQNPLPVGKATLCIDLQKATAAKDLLIDAIEGYCNLSALPATSTVACAPAPKGTPASTQFLNALTAAIAGYNQAASDFKAVVQ